MLAIREAPAHDEELPTLASLKPASRFTPPHPDDKPTIASTPTSISPPSIDPKAPEPSEPSSADGPSSVADPDSPQGLEDEAAQQGAFNEETGEINWDCPCLGGMAHGPCGPEFREAFSCFVFSKEEPKGMDCIEKFKGMQGCFREHPDVYGAELDEDDDQEDLAVAEEGAQVAGALPDDAPRVAAGHALAETEAKHPADSSTKKVQDQATAVQDKAKDTTQSITDAVKQKTADLKDKTAKSTEGLSSRATSAKEQVAETANNLKDRVESRLSSEQGGHSDGGEANADKKDGRLLSDKSHLSSGAAGAQDESETLVPKAAHDAWDNNTEK
jgi:intermembrane space import and assembly protein 40